MRKVFNQFRGMSLDDFQIDNDLQRETVDTLRGYIEHLETNRERGRGLTFVGPPGVGKTCLSCLALKAAEDKGYRIEAIEFSSVVDLIKERFVLQDLVRVGDENALDRYPGVTDHIRRIQGSSKRPADWVLLDDVGREYESNSGWSSEQLFDLLRFRYNRGLPFIITTNYPLPELDTRYGGVGMVSLLTEATELIFMGGEDYRTRLT